uniref:Uncharacterized protein n=1 Tax=Plectus sambesii TaxID=2011161 RepID=A0A914WS97_9BILA
MTYALKAEHDHRSVHSTTTLPRSYRPCIKNVRSFMLYAGLPPQATRARYNWFPTFARVAFFGEPDSSVAQLTNACQQCPDDDVLSVLSTSLYRRFLLIDDEQLSDVTVADDRRLSEEYSHTAALLLGAYGQVFKGRCSRDKVFEVKVFE